MRTILHVDLNNFYASVEMILNPELKDKFVGVCGSVEDRHGIILAKSENAKKMGVKTGMTLREAQKLCPEIVFVEAKHDKYLAYSKLVKKLYLDYTDKIESFGIDECWLDVTSSQKLIGSGEFIANEIRRRVKTELGLTVSVGVSFNKVFAKLGSDLNKPDGTTVISRENYKKVVWPLPVETLLFVGRSTTEKLKKINVKTIGDLALTSPEYLKTHFGKWGLTLYDYACGNDETPVLKYDDLDEIKSVGNSITCYRNLVCDDDVKILFTVLAESVSSRLIKTVGKKATTLTIYIRDEDLFSITRQGKLPKPSALPEDFKDFAFELFKKNYDFTKDIRTIGLSVSGFLEGAEQLTFEDGDYQRKSKLNSTISEIKEKFGSKSVVKGIVLKDKRFMREDPEEEHIVHPEGHL